MRSDQDRRSSNRTTSTIRRNAEIVGWSTRPFQYLSFPEPLDRDTNHRFTAPGGGVIDTFACPSWSAVMRGERPSSSIRVATDLRNEWLVTSGKPSSSRTLFQGQSLSARGAAQPVLQHFALLIRHSRDLLGCRDLVVHAQHVTHSDAGSYALATTRLCSHAMTSARRYRTCLPKRAYGGPVPFVAHSAGVFSGNESRWASCLRLSHIVSGFSVMNLIGSQPGSLLIEIFGARGRWATRPKTGSELCKPGRGPMGEPA